MELVQEDTEVYFQSLNTFRSSLFYHLAICVGWLVARSDLIDAHTCGVTRGSQTIADHHCTQDNPAVIPPCLAWQLFGHSLFFSSELSVCCTIFPRGNRWSRMAKFLSHLTPPKSKKKWHHLKNKAAAHPLATLSPTKATTVKPSGLEAELQEHGVSTNTLTIPPLDNGHRLLPLCFFSLSL